MSTVLTNNTCFTVYIQTIGYDKWLIKTRTISIMANLSGIARQYVERNLLNEQQAQDINNDAEPAFWCL